MKKPTLFHLDPGHPRHGERSKAIHLLAPGSVRHDTGRTPSTRTESFLVLFFKKELLFSSSPVLRLFRNCLLSVLLYVLTFAFILDRPLSLGLLRLEIQQKSARLAALPSPKLVIFAGSNGPYSHSCAVIGAMLHMPCENAGIAVGIGLDVLIRQYAPCLHQGDIVYMPMEFAQYAITRPQTDSGPDGAMLLRHDRALLLTLPPDRILAALLSTNFPNFLEALIEMPMSRVISPGRTLASEYNNQGDRIGATLATAQPQLLAAPGAPPVFHPAFGAALIQDFIRTQSRRGVIIIGGLPTGLATATPSQATIAALRDFYRAAGARFAALPNQSRYPQADFYDSPDHLAQPCQFKHAIAVAALLARTLQIRLLPPSPPSIMLAGTCPG